MLDFRTSGAWQASTMLPWIPVVPVDVEWGIGQAATFLIPVRFPRESESFNHNAQISLED